ncbi:hypothetical protein [Shewanella salipaludis]|uniref:Uncharacterized protein n=1 Tax=Shewanella salipaludis TaxID=2723052 RepID=A0A972FUC4_9GAMM|nr:hypothetical protein [Shewanella salipaludis]NMH65449.1 hypothetical protein [Shewanella salipaludis]
MTGILLILATLFVVLFLFRHRLPWYRAARHPRGDSEARLKISPFHSVSLMSEDLCCQATQDLKGKRFLAREAPHLPLDGCDRRDCHCHYVHHDDRRNRDKNRRTASNVSQQLFGVFGEQERRHRRGRRSSDLQLASGRV